MQQNVETGSTSMDRTRDRIGLAGRRILVVDDSPHIRLFLNTVLAAEGAAVVEAVGGQQALSYCENERFDLIILDLRMPDLDGYQTCAGLRENGVQSPIVAFSADDADRVSVAEGEFSGFLPKPVTPQVLSKELLGILAGRDGQLSG